MPSQLVEFWPTLTASPRITQTTRAVVVIQQIMACSVIVAGTAYAVIDGWKQSKWTIDPWMAMFHHINIHDVTVELSRQTLKLRIIVSAQYTSLNVWPPSFLDKIPMSANRAYSHNDAAAILVYEVLFFHSNLFFCFIKLIIIIKIK